jgi:hypothetical protein
MYIEPLHSNLRSSSLSQWKLIPDLVILSSMPSLLSSAWNNVQLVEKDGFGPTNLIQMLLHRSKSLKIWARDDGRSALLDFLGNIVAAWRR